MARKSKAAEVEVEETEEVAGVSRSAMHIHEAMVEWLESNGYLTGDESTAEVVAVAFAKRNEWRKSEEYAEVKEEYASTREAEKEAKAAARAERAAAKAAAEEDDEEEAPKPKKGKKAAASKAAPAKAKKAKRKSKSADTDDDPFSD